MLADALIWHRLQFAFTITFHYLFPVLTMGLALFIVVMKALALRTGDARWDDAARFWIRIFGINFAVGVVTGIPMEFQFGTNWARLSRYAGPVIGQTLALEGIFAFFLESSFLALLVWGEKRLSRMAHFASAVALFVGSWLSAYFIISTSAFMHHPVGYAVGPDQNLQIVDLGAVLLNPWALLQFAHNQAASVATASFVVAAVGAWYLLRNEHTDFARRCLTLGVGFGFVASLVVAFPTGDLQAKAVARHKPAALAAMEGRFESGPRAGITLIGQPNVAARRLDNPITVPGMLSFLAFGTFQGNVAGLNEFPESDWPDNIELLYYAFHIMAGLGTLMIGLMGLAALALLTRRLFTSRALLWALALAFPFPYIAVTTGWMTAELGRQPWVVYGLLRTADASSQMVHGGTALFTLIGFMGIDFLIGLAFLWLVARELSAGPSAHPHGTTAPEAAHG
ncbi:MAG: cytochrome ubiquinol oxidase subunit I [Gemmatimonas sp.]|nr:cytochrome ubiquinol oxidase subunit I [Gemmatimonas sp.]